MNLTPILTEKSILSAQKDNIYTFVYQLSGNRSSGVSKIEVKEYVAKKYDVNVKNVNAQIRLGKEKRFGNSKKTYFTTNLKFFYVKVEDGQGIPDFNIDSN